MSFITPSTALSGSVLPPRQWNSEVRDNITHLYNQLQTYQAQIVLYAGSVASLSGSVNAIYPQTIGTINSDYVVVTSDLNKMYKVDPAGGTVNIGVGTSDPIGTKVDFVQTGSGTVLFKANVGGTISATPSKQLRTQNSAASIIKLSSTEWLLMGDLY